MTYSEALDWLEQVGRGGSRLGLDRVRAYLTRLGAPQDQIPMIHVAGTNGKGSVSACLSAILTQAGYRVGLYTSPHLDRFNERFRIRGEEISDAAFADLVGQGRAVWETMEDKPTEFEVITALAFLYFAQSACDLVVLEVGLGGRLDATNVIPTPLAAVITKLGLDHTAELGDTLAQIAYEKAGIVKPGGRVVLDGRNTEVLEQLQQLCRERTCSTAITRPDQLTVSRQDITGSTFSYGPWRDLRLTLAGSYQPGNAALALETVEMLRAQGWSVSDDAVRAGLAAVRWPGRFELLCQDPIFLLDGAHNPDGVRAAVESLSRSKAAAAGGLSGRQRHPRHGGAAGAPGPGASGHHPAFSPGDGGGRPGQDPGSDVPGASERLCQHPGGGGLRLCHGPAGGALLRPGVPLLCWDHPPGGAGGPPLIQTKRSHKNTLKCFVQETSGCSFPHFLLRLRLFLQDGL